MSTNNTGGPAFSQCVYNMKGGYDITGGRTLRDYFASKGLQGMLADSNIRGTPAEFAIRAYALADAMLKARKL